VSSQDYTDFECLVIDDGSTDSCPDICDRYAQIDKRFRVIHKKNEGISKTRQLGLEKTGSNYISFIDSDDWISPGFISGIHQKLLSEQCDIVFMDFYETNPAGRELYRSQGTEAADIESVIKGVLSEKLFSCLWNVVISGEFCAEHAILFPPGINYGEDSIFIMKILLQNPKISFLPRAYYHHTYNSKSYTRTNYIEKCNERRLFLAEMDRVLLDHNRKDLLEYNFFPLSAKYEILSGPLFSGVDYKKFSSAFPGKAYCKTLGLRKYVLLVLAEIHFYFIARILARLIRKIKNKIN
jgi:glycosyltransferase involved in cell wall biosynthesis